MLRKFGLRAKILTSVAIGGAICALIAWGTSVYFNDVEFRRGLIEKSRTIHSQLGETSRYVAIQGGLSPMIERYTQLYRTPSQLSEEDRKTILHQVPIYAAMTVGSANAEKENYHFRVFAEEARNPKNVPSVEESAIFARFKADPQLAEIVEESREAVTVYKPVRLVEAQGCLQCHGDPSTSPWKNGKDILGYTMENWKDGRLHGVFAITSRLEEVHQAQVKAGVSSSTKWIGLFVIVGALVALLFNAFMVNGPIRELVRVSERLTQNASEVGGAVSRIFSVSQELASATSQQTEAVQRTAAASEEISAMVNRTAENARESEDASSQSKMSAESGKAVVSQMVLSMEEIRRGNESIASAVIEGNRKTAEIVEVIKEIDQKTKVINDIVFQTKLLSFNASVEAARAGEHGKGFAVVAEEVGKLARMSGDAAHEISTLLDGSMKKVDDIAKETQTAIDALVMTSQEKVSRGTEVANECEAVLSRIVESSSLTSQKISQITVASQEQAAGVAEITQSVHRIDRTTQIGSRSATECSVAAEELSEKVKALREAASSLRQTVLARSTVEMFRWGEEYRLGIREMDDEHQVLIEKMNVLADRLENADSDPAGILTAFRDLETYTGRHFSDEEIYLGSIAYPDLEKHRAIHRVLLAKLADFGREVAAGKADGAQLMDFLNDWLMKHILGVDKRYAEYASSAREAASESERRAA